MDNASRKMLHVEVIDVCEVDGKSINVEKIGFKQGLIVLDKEIKIRQVVHPQIIPLMKKGQYRYINHQIDIWHGGKSLVKHPSKAAATVSMKALQPWIPAIRTHFWLWLGNVVVTSAE